MSTKAKPASKPLTPKQAKIKAVSLLRGMDNSVARVKKEAASMADAASQLKKVLPALSNVMKPAVNAAPKKSAPKKSAPKKSAPKKVCNPQKSAPKKGATKKSAAQNPSKAAQNAKPPVEGRPTIKEAIQEVVQENGAIPPADLWKKCVEKYGYWSRQSLYNALKDTKLFRKTKGKIELPPTSGKKDDGVENFVDGVVADKSVSQAV